MGIGNYRPPQTSCFRVAASFLWSLSSFSVFHLTLSLLKTVLFPFSWFWTTPIQWMLSSQCSHETSAIPPTSAQTAAISQQVHLDIHLFYYFSLKNIMLLLPFLLLAFSSFYVPLVAFVARYCPNSSFLVEIPAWRCRISHRWIRLTCDRNPAFLRIGRRDIY